MWVTAPGSEWDKAVEVNEQQVTTGLSFNGMIEIKSGMESGMAGITGATAVNLTMLPSLTVFLLGRHKRHAR